jgi:septum formation protein
MSSHNFSSANPERISELLPVTLGSKSPRRREMLDEYRIPFTSSESFFHEESIPFEGDPSAFAIAISEGKSCAINSNKLVITADTVVIFEGESFAKAADRADAQWMLSRMQGKWHEVVTGVTIRIGNKMVSGSESTRVKFVPMKDGEITKYLNHIHWQDKAGSYQIQGAGALIVERIEGNYDNVVGLPMQTVRRLLNQLGIDLWELIPTAR